MRAQTRWMIRRDIAEVLNIEAKSFTFPWSEEDFVRCMSQTHTIGRVAEMGETIVGHMVYELGKSSLSIFNMAVHPQHRRRGVGRMMIEDLASKLTPRRRERIGLYVAETNLDAQLFFRACGFRAVQVKRDYYQDDETLSAPEDAYRFVLRLGDRQTAGARS